MYKLLMMLLCVGVFSLYAQENTEETDLLDETEESVEQVEEEPQAEPQEQPQETDLLDEAGSTEQAETQYATSYDDASAVKAILDANRLSWNINSIATFKNGRIVTLNLNNPEVGNEGIRTLPPAIGQLTALEVLTINDNDLSQLPREITNCTNLRRLEIQNNSLSSLPPGISKLVNLRVLDIRNNSLDALPMEIGNLKSIVKLQLWGNRFVTLPDAIGNLSTLKELYLKGNRLSNLPVSITKLNIKYIDVIDNELCGLKGPVDTWLKKFDEKYSSLQKCVGEKRFK